jgi:hypothetical protein
MLRWNRRFPQFKRFPRIHPHITLEPTYLAQLLSATQIEVFLAAALVLALTPGPGIMYVMARTLSGGASDGIASTLGTAVGGLVHVAVRRQGFLRC